MNPTMIDDIINYALNQKASDIHLKADQPPYIRINGKLIKMDIQPLDIVTLENMILSILTEDQKTALTTKKELDFSYRTSLNYQLRVNICYSQRLMAVNFRMTSSTIKPLNELGLPAVVEELCMKKKGLILISGTAGSGKSTTLTYMVDFINRNRHCKVITIEDPIEYIHTSKNSFILQREVGTDTASFIDALKYALRQDPDVLVVGEMRDLESITMALTSAETGHLVLATVHASNAIETINRIIDVFPVDRRQQINIQLANNLLGVIAQSLLPHKDGNGLVLATEVMIANVAIQNLIHRGALNDLRSQLDANFDGASYSLERCLADLITRNMITKTTAHQYVKNTSELEHFILRGASASLNWFTNNQWDNLYKKSILVIDNNQQQRDLIKERLKTKGFLNVETVAKTKETLETLKTLRPDIVILDAINEYLPTNEFCYEIKAMDFSPKLILIAENSSAMERLETTQAFGAEQVVVKTTEYEPLIRAIAKINFSKT
jgi:twitching motility protein PilT